MKNSTLIQEHWCGVKLIHFFSNVPESFWVKYPLLKETTESARTLKKFPKYRNKLARAKKPSEIYRILNPIPNSTLEILFLLEKKTIKQKIKTYLDRYSKVKIFTNGETLKALKIQPGPNYTKIMNEILYQKLDNKIKTKNDEINYIKRTYNV
jgi:tRNA nucleotidyltransferase/poly(A) polymerase